jgi:hypothetical protein
MKKFKERNAHGIISRNGIVIRVLVGYTQYEADKILDKEHVGCHIERILITRVEKGDK